MQEAYPRADLQRVVLCTRLLRRRPIPRRLAGMQRHEVLVIDWGDYQCRIGSHWVEVRLEEDSTLDSWRDVIFVVGGLVLEKCGAGFEKAFGNGN